MNQQAPHYLVVFMLHLVPEKLVILNWSKIERRKVEILFHYNRLFFPVYICATTIKFSKYLQIFSPNLLVVCRFFLAKAQKVLHAMKGRRRKCMFIFHESKLPSISCYRWKTGKLFAFYYFANCFSLTSAIQLI